MSNFKESQGWQDEPVINCLPSISEDLSSKPQCSDMNRACILAAYSSYSSVGREGISSGQAGYLDRKVLMQVQYEECIHIHDVYVHIT